MAEGTGWLRRMAAENTLSRHPDSEGSKETLSKSQFATGGGESGLADWSDEDYANFVERQAQKNAGAAQEARKVGQMKREYHATGGEPKPAPTPRPVRQPKPPDPMRNVRMLRSFANKSRGRYPSGRRVR